MTFCLLLPARLQVSPAEKNTSETLCSLKFAERVRSVELGPVSRKAELASWPSQEQLEVTEGPPAPFLFPPSLQGLPLFCPHTWSLAIGCPPGAASLGDRRLAGAGCPQAAAPSQCWLFQAKMDKG